MSGRGATLELVAAILLACGFSLLTVEVAGGRTLAFDVQMREAVHRAASPPLTIVMRVMSFLGEPYIVWPLAAAACVIFLRSGLGERAVLLLAAMLGALAIEQIVKHVVERARPMAYFGYPLPGSYSFPSGHALQSFTFCIALAALVTPLLRSFGSKSMLWAAAAVGTGSIGFSRVYLGVHYPSDVIGGYLAALMWLLAVFAGNRLRPRKVQFS